MQFEEVKRVVASALSLPDGGASLQPGSPLLGALPELDSMGVVNLIGALEDQFGITVDDDEISASTFETMDTVTAFVAAKLGK
jgi:acyl carrier protein